MKVVSMPTLFISFRALNSARSQNPCSIDVDCPGKENQYCLSGICADIGTCKSVFDCVNPANSYVSIDCVGYKECDQGFCSQVCSEFCENETDCSENQYCASGGCVPSGSCNSDLDCINPKNMFPSISCIGFLECNQGVCGKECSDFCKNGDAPAYCDSDVCAANRCAEGVSCIKNCSDCTAIHFDGSGTQVCVDDGNTIDEVEEEIVEENLDEGKEEVFQPCSIEGDCSDNQYCGSEVCMPNGLCNSDLDCMNPENKYASTRCLGYLKCEEGSCGNVCSKSCENGKKRMSCDRDVCEANSCTEGVSCINNCSDCTAIHFDGSGNQVCVDDGDSAAEEEEDMFQTCSIER